MLSTERDAEVGSVLLEFDGWQVREMVLTPAKLDNLWDRFQQYPTLFSDLTKGSKENFVAMFSQRDSYWMEVYDGDELIGLLYLMNLIQIVDADVHILFFDRRTKNKASLCRAVLRLMFDKFKLHRVSSQIPDIYYATIRLAQDVGFRKEGVKRECILLGGRWRSQVQFGLLASELI